MFDIGFWELIVVAIATLLAVGPERLPKLVRDVARCVRAMRRFVTETRYEIERELEVDAARDFTRRMGDLDDLMRIAPDREPRQGPPASGPIAAAPVDKPRE